ncbi:MAG: hypothetical protein HC806_00335 [Anaerolineae bacterium]|nr:hypothetical protein [Anaerolineae bacterium]
MNVSGDVHVREYLQDKNLLLILDNMEQIINEGTLKWIIETLRTAPHLKFLITSIVRLNIQAETLLEIRGLPYGENLSTPAARLFIERARKTKPTFNPTTRDISALTRLCKLVDGTPLALELAAAWVRGLSLPDIVKEIEHNLDILTVSQHDLPLRHRSMRAVFDHFWNLLSPEEQLTFQRQAVFRGGFTREAFQEVTDTNIPMLASFRRQVRPLLLVKTAVITSIP